MDWKTLIRAMSTRPAELLGLPGGSLRAGAPADVIVIDEVGKMEVESELFTKSVVDALDASKSIVMTLHKKSRNPLLQDIRRRDELRLLEVTPVNKNLLAFKIVHLLTGRSH